MIWFPVNLILPDLNDCHQNLIKKIYNISMRKYIKTNKSGSKAINKKIGPFLVVFFSDFNSLV